MTEDALNLRCIRCGAEGLIRDHGAVAPFRWSISWGAPLLHAFPRDVRGAEGVDQRWEGPGWPWRCPRCEPTLAGALA